MGKLNLTFHPFKALACKLVTVTSATKPEPHWLASLKSTLQAPPVLVGVTLGTWVGILVAVGTLVGVAVGMLVAVEVGP